MVGMNLLAEAPGLAVAADGDRLCIRGPKSAGEIARRLLDHKAEVMAALQAEADEADPRPACPGPGVTGFDAHLAADLVGPEAKAPADVRQAAARTSSTSSPMTPQEVDAEVVSMLIDAGRGWQPPAWADELRRRADLMVDETAADRFRRAADAITKRARG